MRLVSDTGHGGDRILVAFDDGSEVTLSAQASVRVRELQADGVSNDEIQAWALGLPPNTAPTYHDEHRIVA